MKQFIFWVVLITISGYFMLQNTGCTHEPIFTDPIDPIDTIGNPIDTFPIDTTDFVPCDDHVVYFEYDVLPILISNCSVPGCHDDATHEKDIILTSYAKVMSTGKVKPYDLYDSDIYEVITEGDEDKWMPPSPRVRLNQQQIDVIATWISQGAQNLTCDLDPVCNITNVSFAQTVYPIIERNCRGCHSGPAPSGSISLENYTAIRSVAQSGKLYGVTARLPGFIPMPRNRGPLQSCEVAQIKSWIDAGMQEN